MTDTPICVRPDCDRPAHDNAYVCGPCGSKLSKDMLRVALLANDGDPDVTISKQDRIGAGGRRSGPVALPFKPGLREVYERAAMEVETWARHVAVERHHRLPWSLAVAAAYLARQDQIQWLRHRPEAQEAFAALHGAERELSRIVDRRPPMLIMGRCACEAYLYARTGAKDVECKACGTTYDAQACRDQLQEDLDEMLFTAAEIATLAHFLGLVERKTAARKLINQWSVRGLVEVHSYHGEPAYRFGDIIDRLVASRVAA